MKKIKKSIVLGIALGLFSMPAFAAISGTAHDLSSGTANPIAGTSDELCVYCHTPHDANTAVTDAPLWNRDLSGVGAITNVYSNSTLTAVAQAVVTTDIDATDAPLCLSCHDGANLTVALVNPPNSGGGNPAANIPGGSSTLIDLDMRDDHPIGFNYATAVTQDTELNGKVAVETTLGANAVSYGGGDDIWCSSCHDVHGVTGVDTFLRIDNAGSALCLACHNK